MLGAHTGIVESCADGVCFDDLAFFGLEDVGALAVQDAGLALCEGCAVEVTIDAW